MSFETAVSLSPSDLLNRLRIRLDADGWTIIRANGGPGNDQLSVSDGSADQSTQFNFLADDTAATANISCQPSTGDGGASVDFWDHTGSPNISGAGAVGFVVQIGHRTSTTDQGFSGTHTKYFFFTGSTSSGRYCHIVVEGTSGVYFHMAFGTCEKAGTFSGGTYLTATSTGVIANHNHWAFQLPNSSSRNTSWFRDDTHFTSIGQTTDGGASRWFEEVAFAGNVAGASSTWMAALYQGGLQSFNQRTPFCPIWFHVFNSLSPNPQSTSYKICGHVPDMRFVSMDGREPSETIVIGSDTWHLFPMHRKTTDGVSTTTSAYVDTFVSGPAPNHDSNLMGLAYREVT